MSARASFMTVVAVVLGCGPGLPDDGETATTEAGVTDGPATSTPPLGEDSNEGPGVCGDGVVTDDEACDLGPANSDQGDCTANCQAAVCGDGLVWAGHEACDDGDGDDGDECADNCAPPCVGECSVLLFVNAGMRGRFDGDEWLMDFVRGGNLDPELVLTTERVGIGAYSDGSGGIVTVRFAGGAWIDEPLGGLAPAADPTIAASGIGAHLAYQAVDSSYYYARWTGEAWSPKAEAIGSAGPGASRGAIGDVAGHPVFVFIAADHSLQSRARIGGVWQPPELLHPAAYPTRPKIIALDAGAELLVVHRDRYSVRKAGAWSAMTAIPAAVTPTFTLTAFPGGKALLVWTPDPDLITRQMTYDAATDTWSPVGNFYDQFLTFDAPAVAPGIAGAELEVIRTTSGLEHDRRFAGEWAPSRSLAVVGGPAAAVSVE